MTRDSQNLQFFVSSLTNDVLTTAAGKEVCPKTYPFLGVYVTLRQCLWSSLHISHLRVQVRNNPMPCSIRASQVALLVENLPAMQETWVQPLVQEDLLEKGMTTHSSILVRDILQTEEPGRLQSMSD